MPCNSFKDDIWYKKFVVGGKMKYLYHYCNNMKCFSILQSKTIRLSDIRKSNDYNELQLFYPEIFNSIWTNYIDNPFPFCYNGKNDVEAFSDFLDVSKAIWEDKFLNGEFSNFVLCFSEASDSLSQWCRYADDANGCCIGFSKELLQHYCSNSGGILRLEKIEYIEKELFTTMSQKYTDEIFADLRIMRKWIIDNMTHDNNDPNTDGLLSFNFNGMIESIFIDSLKYKDIAFKEEKEWRIFLSNPAYKQPDWVYGKAKIELGPDGFVETIAYLKNKIEFIITSNDLISYLPIKFSEFSLNPVEELWLGPKNRISKADIELFIKKNEYLNMRVSPSYISYK